MKILEKLVKIREALTEKPAPPPEPKGLWMEFIDFFNKYGVMGLYIGFIIGSASKDLVSALVADIGMPVITSYRAPPVGKPPSRRGLWCYHWVTSWGLCWTT